MSRPMILISSVVIVVGACATWDAGNPRHAALQPDPASGQPISRAMAERFFERFTALAGTWRSRSTAGWEGRVTFSTIARDTVVLSTSQFTSQADGGMATAVHMDGERLLLTHYCEARNQPRLVASSAADGGRTVRFTFVDGTNLASRDQGHMDKVVWRFEDDDTFTTRWTWYQDGRESWMEEIRHSRIRE